MSDMVTIREDDLIEIEIDRRQLTGRIDLVGTADGPLSPDEANAILKGRDPHPALAPNPRLPDDTRLWAALQRASGGTWAGCVYDVDRSLVVRRDDAVVLGLGHALAGRAQAQRLEAQPHQLLAPVGVEAVEIEMAVAVDQHQAASLSGSSIRGNRPSGLSSR